jgi:hypothetical protein
MSAFVFGSEKVFNIQVYILSGFEVLTAVVINSSAFWSITSYNPLKVNRRFGRNEE